MLAYPDAAKVNCGDCQAYERTGWTFKTDEYGRRVKREEPIFCLKTSSIDNGCPNQFRPDGALTTNDEIFFSVYSLCKEFGWTIDEALKAPAWFVPRYQKFTEIRTEYEQRRHEEIMKKHG